MQNKKILILVTNYFPFWRGEEYLETELSYLSETFSRILIVPVMVNQHMKQTRSIPANVEILNVLTDHSLKGKFKMVFGNKNNIGKEAQHKMQINILHRIFEYYFQTRSWATWKAVKSKLINNLDFPKETPIYIYSYWLYLTAMVGIEIKEFLISRGFKVKKIVSRAHGYDVNEDANRLNYLPCREYLVRNLNFIFPVSTYGKKMLIRRVPQYKEKIVVKRLGVKSKSTKAIKRNGTSIYLVSCSTVRPLKRLDKIIDTLAIFEKEGIQYHWVHLGSGQSNYEKKIHRYAQKKLNSDCYNFYGHIRNDEVIEHYKNEKISLFINVSESEGTPVSIMEAFSMSIPVLATNVGGTADIVEDGFNGFLVDKHILPKEISQKILEISNFPQETYQKLTQNAFSTWETKINEEKNYREFCEALVEGEE